MGERRHPGKTRRAGRRARPLHGVALAEDLRNKAIGDACEALVRRALGAPTRPWWILKVRAARRHEDRRHGVDVVVHTDVGRILLQVKRSLRWADKWLAAYANDPRPIGLVVARETEAVEVVYGRALGVLILLRERLEMQAEAAPKVGVAMEGAGE